MTTVLFNDREIDMEAARMLMDDDICELIHARPVATEQEFLDAYLDAHFEKYGQDWVFG